MLRAGRKKWGLCDNAWRDWSKFYEHTVYSWRHWIRKLWNSVQVLLLHWLWAGGELGVSPTTGFFSLGKNSMIPAIESYGNRILNLFTQNRNCELLKIYDFMFPSPLGNISIVYALEEERSWSCFVQMFVKHCYGQCVSQNSYVEAQIPTMMVFGDVMPEGWFGLYKVTRIESS